MSLDMGGFIDDVFVSIPATQTSLTNGFYDPNGLWVEGVGVDTSYIVNIQPMNDREIQQLELGAERINDARKIYVNDGDFHALSPDAYWTFTANNRGPERYKVISSDVRVWRRYAKIMVVLIDG